MHIQIWTRERLPYYFLPAIVFAAILLVLCLCETYSYGGFPNVVSVVTRNGENKPTNLDRLCFNIDSTALPPYDKV